MPAEQTQEALRRAFGCWGRPKKLRVDNGIPWATSSGLPSALSLWAAGLDIGTHRNDPYRPQQNGVVESTQGTSQRWVEPGSCANFAQLCQRVVQEDRMQREVYPAIDGRSRRAAYPFLAHSGHGYTRGWEQYGWDLQAALQMLSSYRVRRWVSKRGQVSMYHRLIQVGEDHGGSEVQVQFDAASVEWVIRDLTGREVRRRPAAGFTGQEVRTLAIARKSTKRGQGKGSKQGETAR